VAVQNAAVEFVMNWFGEQRIEWIAETLRVFGFIQRRHLMRKFGISTPQATNDLREYQRRFPRTIRYDRSRKMYVTTVHDEQAK
jgi:hypothetical protein